MHLFVGLGLYSWEYEILGRFLQQHLMFIELFNSHELRNPIIPILQENHALKSTCTESLDIIYYALFE